MNSQTSTDATDLQLSFVLRLGEFFSYPFLDQDCFFDTSSRCDPPYGLGLTLIKTDRYLVSTSRKDRFRDFLQLFLEIGDIVRIPETGEFFDRVCLGYLLALHFFFHCLNRRSSLGVIGRAVIG